jgi:eukaryotic translation initiation factor 2C
LEFSKYPEPRAIGKIAYIYFSLENPRPGAEKMMYDRFVAFEKYLKDAGMNCNLSRTVQNHVLLWQGGVQDKHDAENQAIVRGAIRNLQLDKTGPPNFIFVVLPMDNAQIYSQLKTIADTELGVHTVCVTMKVIDKAPDRLFQVFGNLSMKVNLKLGGINQVLKQRLGMIDEGKTMVVGLDVTHPSPGSKLNAPSVAAIMASVDRFLGQWPSDFKAQKSRMEMIDALESLFIGRLRMWQKFNKAQLP